MHDVCRQEALGKASSVMPAGPSITFAEIAGFASQILEALAQIHGCGVLHKGLVAKHVLVSLWHDEKE